MKDLTWIKNLQIAHRGLHTEDKKIPENTMLAFDNAIKNGYGIEMDINVLKDGTVIVFHDNNLKRLTGIDKFITEVTYDDIQNLTIYETNETIPTLQEVLEFVNGRVPLLIELKPLGNNNLLCKGFIENIKNYQGKFAIHTFSPFILIWFKKHYPNIIRGQITEFFSDDPKMNKITKYLMKTMFFNRFSKPDFINYGIKDLPNKYCDKLHKKGMCIISYASRSQKEFNMVKKYYDNSVFEFFIPKK